MGGMWVLFWVACPALILVSSWQGFCGEPKNKAKPRVDYSKSNYKSQWAERGGHVLGSGQKSRKQARTKRKQKKRDSSDSPYFLKQESRSPYLFDSKGNPKKATKAKKVKKAAKAKEAQAPREPPAQETAEDFFQSEGENPQEESPP